MNTYVVSSLGRKEERGSLVFDHETDGLFSTAPSTIKFEVRYNGKENFLFIFTAEKVLLNFSYLKEERFFDLNTVSIVNLEKSRTMLSFVEGIGILKRGGSVKYISSEINSIIGNSLFGDPTFLELREFSEKEMQWDRWNGTLKGITLELPDLGYATLEGKDIESRMRDMNLYPNNENKIMKIWVYNKILGRDIQIDKRGKMKISFWNGGINPNELKEKNSLLTFEKKMAELYGYIEGVLGVDHEETV